MELQPVVQATASRETKQEEPQQHPPRPPRVDTRTVGIALVIGYIGSGYMGLQEQAVANRKTKKTGDRLWDTIEGKLLQAIGPVLQTKTPLSRCSRTDKGVSAVMNVISTEVKRCVLEELGGMEGATRKLNEKLQELGATALGEADAATKNNKSSTEKNGAADQVVQSSLISVHLCMRVWPRFDGREQCRRRVYHYLIPLFALNPKSDDFAGLWSNILESDEPTAPQGESTSTRKKGKAQEWANPIIEHLNTIFCSQLSNRPNRWYNYSEDSGPKQLKPTQDQCVRHMHRMALTKKLLWLPTKTTTRAATSTTSTSNSNSDSSGGVQCEKEEDDAEVEPFVLFQVEGASFLMHMIRKIMGILIALARGARHGLLEDSLGGEHVLIVPTAPGEGLLLNFLHFDSYDAKEIAAFPSFGRGFTENAAAIEKTRTAIRHSISAHGTITLPMTKFLRMLRMHNWCIKRDVYKKPAPFKDHEFNGGIPAGGVANNNLTSTENSSGRQKRQRDGAEEKSTTDAATVSTFSGEAAAAPVAGGETSATTASAPIDKEEQKETVAEYVARMLAKEDGWVYDHPGEKEAHWTGVFARVEGFKDYV